MIESIEPALRPGASFYIWNGHANFGLMQELLTPAKMKPRQIITWAKESFAPGFGAYNEQTEFCLYGRKSGRGGYGRGLRTRPHSGPSAAIARTSMYTPRRRLCRSLNEPSAIRADGVIWSSIHSSARERHWSPRPGWAGGASE